ncbi:hypothetical protein A9G34_09860 [Gilliamella sp. Choc4-2]|uniref:hypothetical protein n=1 Tax=unclassified Gilliamella TaxID=2685620 RepID=UPI00080E4AF1|nr:hypothetical protein [Gilliamella apicola]OCG32490.1 hypothetical protein A9G33_03780 [Gilliamella apicola]OCG43104.1 hypothetical protein A9G34_09860 [Gilliamella apicola]
MNKQFRKICQFLVLTLLNFYSYAGDSHSLHAKNDSQLSSISNVNLYEIQYIDYIKNKSKFAFIPITNQILAHGGNSVMAFLIPHENNHVDPINTEYKKKIYLIESQYREILIAKAGLSDSDTVFIYDNVFKQILSFDIQDLQVLAIINPNNSTEEGPFYESDYLLGFEINADKLKNFTEPLVYIGKKNPFTK